MELNLRPASVVKARETAARIPCLVMAAVCLLAILAGWWGYLAHAATVQTAVSDQLQEKIVSLQGVEKQFNAVKAVIKAKQEVVVPLIQAVQDREYWVRLIQDLNSRLPEHYIWVTSMELESAKADAASAGKGATTSKLPVLVLKGFYVGPDAGNPKGVAIVDDFANALAKSPLFKVHSDKDRSPTVPPDDWAAAYTIRLDLQKSSAQ